MNKFLILLTIMVFSPASFASEKEQDPAEKLNDIVRNTICETVGERTFKEVLEAANPDKNYMEVCHRMFRNQRIIPPSKKSLPEEK